MSLKALQPGPGGRRLVVTLLGLALLLVAATALGADEPARDLSKYKEEPVPGGTLLVAAYGVMWALVGVYLVRLAGRQSKAEQELRALEDRLTHGIRPGQEQP